MQIDQSLEEQVAHLMNNLSSTSSAPYDLDPLPSLPIMAATRLQLDLLLSNSVIDLKTVAEVVMADAGATLQILRLIGEEFPNADDRPRRIEDCIVSLSLTRCYQTICSSQIPHSGPHVAEWQRCRLMAECVRELASGLDGGLSRGSLPSRLVVAPWNLPSTTRLERRQFFVWGVRNSGVDARLSLESA